MCKSCKAKKPGKNFKMMFLSTFCFALRPGLNLKFLFCAPCNYNLIPFLWKTFGKDQFFHLIKIKVFFTANVQQCKSLKNRNKSIPIKKES